MHLVGYLYEDYHDARSLGHKVFRHKLIIWPENGRNLFETFSRVVYTNEKQ
jgi:hypothetical protein